jgi:hypothetical protein
VAELFGDHISTIPPQAPDGAFAVTGGHQWHNGKLFATSNATSPPIGHLLHPDPPLTRS